MSDVLLDIRGLSVSHPTPQGPIPALRDVSLQVESGEVVALVGESGSGKSTLAFSVAGLIEQTEPWTSGEIIFEGAKLSNRRRRPVRGSRIGMVFQDARASLNPVLSIGSQLLDTLRSHAEMSKKESWNRAVKILNEVGLAEPEKLMRQYRHELSGGMCQRVAIALGVCSRPSLLIADEPTSGLDTNLQSQVLDLLVDLKRRHQMALILISHNLDLVSTFADRLGVLYHGRLIELGPARRVLDRARHPYTRALTAYRTMRSLQTRQTLPVIPGNPPSPQESLIGCAFAPRCSLVEPRCKEQVPAPVPIAEGHWAACIHALEKESE